MLDPVFDKSLLSLFRDFYTSLGIGSDIENL